MELKSIQTLISCSSYSALSKKRNFKSLKIAIFFSFLFEMVKKAKKKAKKKVKKDKEYDPPKYELPEYEDPDIVTPKVELIIKLANPVNEVLTLRLPDIPITTRVEYIR